MLKTRFIFLFYFLFQLSLINSASVDPVTNPKSWTPDTLYKKLKETYLHQNNPNYNTNLKYMLFDPEYYLQEANLQDAYNAMYTLYEKYNVSTHVFFISSMDEKYKTDEAYAAFADRLSYLIYNNNDKYNDNATLTAIFFIKDRKMRIRTTKALRQIITDDDALNILNKRKKDLKNSNFEEVANGLMMDIFKTYSRNVENPNSHTIILLTILFIIGMSLLFYLANREQPSAQEDRVKAFLDKCKNRSNPREIFTESCIICLEDFKSSEEIHNLQSTNMQAYENAETSTLECGHKFHRKCISDWLKKEENCPICRMKFDLKSDRNNNNKSGSMNNVNFSHILENILRVQIRNNSLNRTEINRIRRVYNPGFNPHNYDRDYSAYQGNYDSNSSSHSHSHSHSSPKQSYKSHNEGSGGATSGW